jgi:hypothetical protein
VLEERLPARLGGAVPDHRVEIGLAALEGVARAGLDQRGVGRDPEGAARAGGRAADVLGLLDDEDVEALLASAQGSGEPGARADDEEVHGGVGHDGVLSQYTAY